MRRDVKWALRKQKRRSGETEMREGAKEEILIWKQYEVSVRPSRSSRWIAKYSGHIL